jgi:glycosyltransferase involved in cell wall biosynthesis
MVPGATAEGAYDIVIPTVGRSSLAVLLDTLAAGVGSRADGLRQVFVVDDSGGEAEVAVPTRLADRITVLRTPGRTGPAAARNRGWQAGTAPLVVFLDDDVVPADGWAADLEADRAACVAGAGAVQARIVVPTSERPTDWERSTARLERARWITADLVVRRAALEAVHGFDERFPRAYREDTDLALRLLDAGWVLRAGRRTTWHPVRRVPWWISVVAQRGNADDALLVRLHGPHWRARVGEPRGRLRWHAVSVAFLAATALAAVVAVVSGRRRPFTVAGVGWGLLTLRFAWERIGPGPRRPCELAAMLLTTPAIPPLAVLHRTRGWWRCRAAEPWSKVHPVVSAPNA